MGNTGVVKWPFGADAVHALSATGAQAITINTQFAIIDGVTVQATAHRTINLTIGANLQRGAILLVQSKTAATEDTVFGTNITGSKLVGVAGKTINKTFIYNGTAFVSAGLQDQID
jgi:hypothetical protein